MQDTFDKNRIVKNSLLLYVRMMFTMWLNLYATRLVLQNLGVEDMGVYAIVGSITTLFTVFIGGITSAVQRFLTFELGLKDGRPNAVFCSSLNVIFIICVFLLVLLEVGGLWVLYNKVNIPTESMDAAFWVYQLSILTCIVNIISIPYNTLVIAHEKMNVFAAISILQVILTCATAYCLSFFANDRLLIYAVLTASVSIVIRIIYQVYCHIQFVEARYHPVIERAILLQMAKCMGIHTISGVLFIIANQGIVFVINWTLGVTFNAVYNIAQQLRNMILSFVFNVQKAIAPQITKTYASGDLEHHRKLVYCGSKLQVYMIYFLMIPFLFRTEYILTLWLGEVPPHTVIFARCSIFVSLGYAMLEPIRTAVIATNRIGRFNLIPDSVFLLVLPIPYIINTITHSADWVIVSIITTELLVILLRMWYATKVGSINVRETVMRIIIPCALLAVMSSAICCGLNYIISEGIVGLIVLLILNSLFLCCAIYAVGLNYTERAVINKIVRDINKRVIHQLR